LLGYVAFCNHRPDPNRPRGRSQIRLDIAGSAYMASIAKYPKRNVQLRHGARIIKKHDGAPPPPPLVERDPNLKNWSVHLIGKKLTNLGWVEAVDEAGAIERAVVLFNLDDERRKRLAVI
jgi:hypothetical protein